MSFESTRGPAPEEAGKAAGAEQMKKTLESIRLHPEDRERLIQTAFEQLKASLEQAGGTYHQDVNEIYQRYLPSDHVLIRREDPGYLIETVSKGDDLVIAKNPSDVLHANAAEWIPKEGPGAIQSATLGGFGGREGLVTIVGFRKGKDVHVRAVEGESKRAGHGIAPDTHKDIYGNVHRGDLEFVVVRIPATLMKEDQLTERELDRLDEAEGTNKVVNIYRGFSLG